MIRLFVALGLPDGLTQRLDGLHMALPGAHWVAPETMHVTLRFIGEVSQGEAADIDDMLARIAMPAFDLKVCGVGSFASKGRLRTLWAGVEKSPDLSRLQAKVETACQRAGQMPEGRRFLPHVTLARCGRIREELAGPFLGAYAGFSSDPIRVDAFTLYSSQTGHDGPVYRPERRYPLSGGGADDVFNDDARFAELAAEWAEE
jgi:RNA 2',3'-cyclic 3'-phosphodiesterase